MCGICGTMSLRGAGPDPSEIAVMQEALAHRGPDGAGCFAAGPVALGMRRLALVDLEGGTQPVRSEDGRVVAVCNGEIYNAPDLRRDLQRRGHGFSSRCDVEVVVHLYEEHGDAFVERLRGMFAVALWDEREGRLLLARDRFGIKPLYWARLGGDLLFASELKALTALERFPRALDPDALEAYLATNAVPAPLTIFRAAAKLPAGSMLVARDGVEVRRWAADVPAPAARRRGAPLRSLAGELERRLSDSVAAHLQADVPVGVLLSGGVDSGVITALAARHAGAGLPTFTLGFRERDFDELELARAVARRYATDHHEVVLDAGAAAASLEAVARTFDEPRGDATAVPYWLAAREAAGHVKAVMTGEGGDELLCGYQTYVASRWGAPAARAAALLRPAVERRPSSSGRLALDFKLRRLALGAGLPALERHHAWKETFTGVMRDAILTGERGTADPLAAHRALWEQSAGATRLARLQHVDIGTFLADDLLVQADRASMAHGLEVRVPFLDERVAALARALPDRARLRGTRTKRLLRIVAAPLLPAAVARGPKRGFVAPAAAWLRGELQPLARDVLSEAALRRQGVFEPAVVHALLDRHVARREDLSRPLWALIAFTLWHDAHAAAPTSSDLRIAA